MADHSPHDVTGDSGNGATDGERGTGGHARSDHEADQTLADTDQTLADSDQTGSESDQTSADEDQLASDRDQAASDRDYTHGGDAEVHRVTQQLRARGTLGRELSAQQRVEAAASRDAAAHARDLAALARDRAAALRDRELAARDTRASEESAEGVLRRAAADRAAAADNRARAAGDREHAARDRADAARGRAQARADRDVLLSYLTAGGPDPLTGPRIDDAGLRERFGRADARLVVAYVQIIGLKAVDEAGGLARANAVLRRVVNAIRAELRADDLIVRIDDDAFLCALSDTTEAEARSRFGSVQAGVAQGDEPRRLLVGFAGLAPDAAAQA